MRAISHAIQGTAGYAILAVNTDAPLDSIAIASALAGSLLPDLDSRHSWLGRRLLPLSIPVQMLLGRRGALHSMIPLIAGGLLWSQAPPAWEPIIAAALVGYAIHILGDWLSGSVPLLWPWQRRFSAPVRVRLGGPMEIALTGVIGLVLVGLLIQQGMILAEGETSII